MKEELRSIIKVEIEAVEGLLEALELQHNALIKSDAITLENCVANIEDANRALAAAEVKRRDITKGHPMSEVVANVGDMKIDEDYRKMKRLLEEVRVQKDTNDLLIKQGLGFTSRLLNIFNPSRTPKTYNSYGKFAR